MKRSLAFSGKATFVLNVSSVIYQGMRFFLFICLHVDPLSCFVQCLVERINLVDAGLHLRSTGFVDESHAALLCLFQCIDGLVEGIVQVVILGIALVLQVSHD